MKNVWEIFLQAGCPPCYPTNSVRDFTLNSSLTLKAETKTNSCLMIITKTTKLIVQTFASVGAPGDELVMVSAVLSENVIRT